MSLLLGTSRVVDLDGPVHYADHGGAGRPIVLVHGLGGSHLNWLPVAPRLAAHGRVLALDLAGHGRTPSLGRTARVSANRRLLGRFLAEVAAEPAVLIGNSMGGTVALAEAAAEPARVSGLVLVSAALPVPGWLPAGVDPRVLAMFTAMAVPLLGEAVMRFRARRGPEAAVRDLLALCGLDPDRVDREVYQAHLALTRERWALGHARGKDFLSAQRSLMGRLVRRRRFRAMVESVRAPALVLQGDRDRLVRVASARALTAARPDWHLEVLEGVGHVPQLEVPARFLALVEPWLAALPAAR